MEVVRSIFEPGAEAPAYSRECMSKAATLLLDAAAKTGKIRGDLDPADVLLAVAASTWTVAGDGRLAGERPPGPAHHHGRPALSAG